MFTPRLEVVALLVTTSLLSGCVGSGTPRKPKPPAARSATSARAVVDIRGLRDAWDAQLLFLEGLRQTPGVQAARVDEASGSYWIDHDPRRISRDGLRLRILELGREQQLQVDPIFADR